MKFKELHSEVFKLQKKQQELESTVYTVLPVNENYIFVAYYDSQAGAMGYTVTDTDFVEIKLLSDLDAEAMIAYGKFVETIEAWQKDENMDFPYAQFSGRNIPEHVIRSEFDVNSRDEKYDGDEAKLE